MSTRGQTRRTWLAGHGRLGEGRLVALVEESQSENGSEKKSWLPDMDLNHDKQIQSLLCYRYTIGQ